MALRGRRRRQGRNQLASGAPIALKQRFAAKETAGIEPFSFSQTGARRVCKQLARKLTIALPKVATNSARQSEANYYRANIMVPDGAGRVTIEVRLRVCLSGPQLSTCLF